MGYFNVMHLLNSDMIRKTRKTFLSFFLCFASLFVYTIGRRILQAVVWRILQQVMVVDLGKAAKRFQNLALGQNVLCSVNQAALTLSCSCPAMFTMLL